MFVTYAPEDSSEPPRMWEFDPKRVRSSEQVIVEKQFGGRSWSEFVAAVMKGSAEARRVLLCHLMRREHPALQLRDVPDFMDCELLVEQSAAELMEGYRTWVAGGGPAGPDGSMLEAMFLSQIEEAEAKFGDPAGKAPSRNELAATSGPSPRCSESPPGSSASG